MNSLIAISIRQNNLNEYRNNRHSAASDDGLLEFENEDFSNINFEHFSMGLSHFKKCKLDNSTGLYGQPIVIEKCSATGIDFRDVSINVKAVDSNFSGMLFNDNTNFGIQNPGNKKIDSENMSVFENCILDKKFINFAKKRADIIIKNHKSTDVI